MRAPSAWWLIVSGLVVVLSFSVLGEAELAEEQATTRNTRSSRTSSARETASTRQETTVEGMLEKILANQQRILARLDEVMKELQIVKIRATLK